MSKLIPALLLSVSGIMMAAVAHADGSWGNWGNWWGENTGNRDHHFNAPEIDPASAITALTLLVGGMTVLRSRINKK
jgi:hypothetical protein